MTLAEPSRRTITILCSGVALGVYIPALWGFYFLAIVLLGFYRINRSVHTENLNKLAASRTQAAATGAK